MEQRITEQLADLAEAFDKIGLKPVICGGLGIYLCFHGSESQDRQLIRATTDIDLMLTESQVVEQAQRQAIAEIITDRLQYVVREGREHLHFEKDNDQLLDILAPPMDGFKCDDVRIKLVSSQLHGRVTKEACFVEEDLRAIPLSVFLSDDDRRYDLRVQVPSPTNLLLLKLFAFNDRDESQRFNPERAQAHALDIYITIMLTSRADYLVGQQFLARHEDSVIIQTAQSIVWNKFYTIEQSGWRRVLESSIFYPDLNRREKETKLEEAKRRLIRWFKITHEK